MGNENVPRSTTVSNSRAGRGLGDEKKTRVGRSESAFRLGSLKLPLPGHVVGPGCAPQSCIFIQLTGGSGHLLRFPVGLSVTSHRRS